RPEMAKIFSEETQFELWLLVEEAVADVQTRHKILPEESGRNLVKKLRLLRERKKYSISKFRKLEEKTKHEFLAFLEMTAESLGKESAYLHLGLTSSDVLDTSLMLQLQAGCMQLLSHFDLLLPLLKKRANEFRDLITVGRTHGM